jgi:hypothetical protein
LPPPPPCGRAGGLGAATATRADLGARRAAGEAWQRRGTLLGRRAGVAQPRMRRRLCAKSVRARYTSLKQARRRLRRCRSAARARLLTWQTVPPQTTPLSVPRVRLLARGTREKPARRAAPAAPRLRSPSPSPPAVQPPAITVSAAAQPPAGACRCASRSACAALHATASALRRACSGLGGAAISVSRSSLTLNTLRRQGTPGARPPPPPVVSYR